MFKNKGAEYKYGPMGSSNLLCLETLVELLTFCLETKNVRTTLKDIRWESEINFLFVKPSKSKNNTINWIGHNLIHFEG